MADLQFHSNHCQRAESARGTVEESRLGRMEREGEDIQVGCKVSAVKLKVKNVWKGTTVEKGML